MNSGLGQFPCKERKLLKEECGPATPELTAVPAKEPQRVFLRTGVRGGKFCYNYVAAFPSAGALRNRRSCASRTLFSKSLLLAFNCYP